MHTRKGLKKEGSTRTLIQKEGKANKTQREHMRVITAGGKTTKGWGCRAGGDTSGENF